MSKLYHKEGWNYLRDVGYFYKDFRNADENSTFLLSKKAGAILD